jgi:hypothetical protein
LTNFRKPTIAIALAATLTIATVSAASSSPPNPHGYPPEAGAQIVGHTADLVAVYLNELTVEHAINMIGHMINDYVTTVEADIAAAAARVRDAATPASPRAAAITVGNGGGGGGGSCGGATNGADQFIHRESGGNPQAVNPSSGAYGCYQVLGSTWASACGDINGGHPQGSSPAQQAACASRLPLSAWGG